jgi:hypothetical protein
VTGLDSIRDWMTNKRFIAVVIILILMWCVLIGFFYLKADEVTKDPCGICAEKMGKEVICTAGTFILSKKTYYPNGSIMLDVPDFRP